MDFRFFNRRRNAEAVLVALLVVILASGCYLTPDFGPPGTFEVQRNRAVVHDPFPDNDIAPPIMGGRPLGFDRPMAEAEKSQTDFRNNGARVIPYQGF